MVTFMFISFALNVVLLLVLMGAGKPNRQNETNGLDRYFEYTDHRDGYRFYIEKGDGDKVHVRIRTYPKDDRSFKMDLSADELAGLLTHAKTFLAGR